MYYRLKSIKGYKYWYKVSSHRIDGRVVQKFEKYIGKENPEQFSGKGSK